MTETSARHGLPFILPGQAQKEAFHNEALAAMDALLHPAVEGPPTASVPADPEPGQCWIVAAGAGGDWAGEADAIAVWTDGGWRFCAPQPGMTAWDKVTGYWLHWTGSAWSAGELVASEIRVAGQKVVGSRQPEVPSPSGGTTIDAEARAAIDALIATLKTHGLVD